MVSRLVETSDQGGLVGELVRTASRGESVETYELTRTGIATNPSHLDPLISLKRKPKYIRFREIQRCPRTAFQTSYPSVKIVDGREVCIIPMGWVGREGYDI